MERIAFSLKFMRAPKPKYKPNPIKLNFEKKRKLRYSQDRNYRRPDYVFEVFNNRLRDKGILLLKERKKLMQKNKIGHKSYIQRTPNARKTLVNGQVLLRQETKKGKGN